ncbi:hypothetical protein L7F22_050328 [Adiantum nelumboides]|nr:hypothetical protein [Adiantum nelumboides]
MWMLNSPSGNEVVPKGEVISVSDRERVQEQKETKPQQFEKSAGHVEQETQKKIEESPHTKSDSTDDGLEAGEEKKEPQPLDIEEKKEPKAKPDIEKLVVDVQVDHEEVKEIEVPNNNWEMQAKESQGEKEKVEGEEQNPDEEAGSKEEPKKEDAAKKAGSEGKSDSDEWTLCDSEDATDYIP